MTQELFNWALGIITTGGTWWLKTMWDDHRALETKVAAIEVLVAGQYVRRDEMTAAVGKLEANLERNFQLVFAKLDNKADKP